MTLDTEQIQQIIDPYVSRLSRAIWPTWDRFIKNIPESDRGCFNPTCEANILHCYMADAVRREFSGVPGVVYLERYKFCLGIDGFPRADGMVVCRLKRLNEVGQSRAYPTDRARDISCNDGEIDGLPPGATVLDVGYVLNDLGTGYSDVQVVRVLGVKYVMSIPRDVDSSLQMPSSLFAADGQQVSRFEIIRPREVETGSGSR